MNDRITVDPNRHGQACVKGTRIPVHQIVHMLANGDSMEEIDRMIRVNARGYLDLARLRRLPGSRNKSRRIGDRCGVIDPHRRDIRLQCVRARR